MFRSEYDEPREIRFKRVGGDLPVLEGTWTLLPLANGTRTRLVYMARLGITTVVPTAILRGLIRSEVTSTLEDLRAEAVRARKR